MTDLATREAPEAIRTTPPAGTRYGRGGVDLVQVARQAEAAKALGETLIASGLLPDAIKRPEQAMAVMIKGQELQIPPMQALSHINVIKGKPTMSAELMRALAQRAGHKIRVIETTAQSATVEGIRADDPGHATRITFDEEDVRRAGLQNQSGHKNYPAALKLARATSALCRAVFADAIGGVSYTPEELGADVDEDGQLVEHAPVREIRRSPNTADADTLGRGLDGSEDVEETEVVEGDPVEPDSEHEDLLRLVGEAYNALPEDQRPDKRAVWEFAKRGEDDARKSLERLRALAEGPAEEAPNPDEIEGVERGGATDIDGNMPAGRGQLDELEGLANDLAPEGDGMKALEDLSGKKLKDFTRDDADEWLRRLAGERS